MKTLALVLVGVVAATGCKQVFGPSIKGSGKMGTRTVAVGPGKAIGEFKKIESNGSFDIEVTQGPQSDIVITGDDNIISIVELQISGDTLKVRTSEGYSTNNPLKLTVTIPSVEAVELNGSGNVVVSNLKGDSLQLEISGSGGIDASGTTTSLDADISGSGGIDASALASENVSASISGSGSIQVDATKTLKADVSGSGSISYKGSPTVEKDITGSGEVKPQ